MKTALPLASIVRSETLATLMVGLVVVTMTASNVTAQEIPETGGKVFGLVGGSFGDGGSSILTSGGAGIRLTRQLGVDFEVLHVSGLNLAGQDRFLGEPISFAPPIDIERDGGLTAFLSKIAVDFPVGERVIPFLSGGGGVGHLSEQISFRFGNDADRDTVLSDRLRNFRRGGRPVVVPPFGRAIDRSETGMVLTVGGGVDVRLWRGLSIGAEARWLRLLAGRDDFDFAHITSRVAYRF